LPWPTQPWNGWSNNPSGKPRERGSTGHDPKQPGINVQKVEDLPHIERHSRRNRSD